MSKERQSIACRYSIAARRCAHRECRCRWAQTVRLSSRIGLYRACASTRRTIDGSATGGHFRAMLNPCLNPEGKSTFDNRHQEQDKDPGRHREFDRRGPSLVL